MQNDTDQLRQYHINADIIELFQSAATVSWYEIRDNSIHRILYLASILFSFRTNSNDHLSPFNDYRFNVGANGPYDSNIEKSISFLFKDDYLIRAQGDDTYILDRTISPSSVKKFPDFEERAEWIKIVVYILNIYTENRIYDFIFRDPQYQLAIKSNTQQGLNTNASNETIKTLNLFKLEFEAAVSEDPVSLSNQQYLELYFEYVFSKILKREQ